MTTTQAVRVTHYFSGKGDLTPAELAWEKALEPIKDTDFRRYMELNAAASTRTSEAFDFDYAAALGSFDNGGAVDPVGIVRSARAAMDRIVKALELAERDMWPGNPVPASRPASAGSFRVWRNTIFHPFG